MTTPPAASLCARALEFAQRGWRVFPLLPDSKKPHAGSAGFHDATDDADTIRAAWQTCPQSNVGIATGKPSNVFVLDVDCDPEGKIDGMAELKRLEKKHGPLPQTFTVLTPRGGRHLFFQMPDALPIKSRTDVLARGLDVRGDGGYVVGPGSRLGDKSYKVLNATPPAMPPPWLVAMVRKEAAAPAVNRTQPVAAPQADEAELCSALEAVPAENYNDWLHVGMALHNWNTERGLSIWHTWSATCAEKYDAATLENKWQSFGGSNGAVTAKTIFHMAIKAGWKPPSATLKLTKTGSVAANFAEVTAWIRGETLRTLGDKETLPTVKNSLVAKLVVDALAQVGRFYFHADLRDFASALYFNAHSKRLERIRSDVFLSWLSNWLVINRASGLFKYVSSEVETAALSSEHTTAILPEAYFAARPQALYLSCGDGLAVRITASGVATVDNGTDGVLFAAGKTLAPWTLVEPRDAFETCAIFRNAHSSAQHGRTLLQLWLYSFATMPRSKPPLGAIGEIGCGKTRTLKGIAELYGFPFRAAKVEEQLEPNFWPNVNEGGLFVLDNADTKCRWLADAVAAAATDGCSQRRKLYTNSETVTLRANSWLAITAANPTFGNDAGLADRLLVVRMARRDGDASSDSGLTDEILANRDAGLSHLAETLGKALADTAPVPSGLNKRHPDFAAFAVRIGRALGREAEAVAALSAAEADKSAFCLENDTIGTALVAYLRTESFHGTAAELVPKLVEQDAELQDRLSAKRLGKRLAAIWPHLQSVLAVAKREQNRASVTEFRFESAGFAGFEMDFPQKS